MDQFQPSRDENRKEVKQLVLLIAVLWIINTVLIVGLVILFGGQINFTPVFLVALLPLVLTPILLFGLWNFKKWALFMGYILYGINMISSILSLSILGIIISGLILYTLYKARNNFS
jgi:hypothetical protein